MGFRVIPVQAVAVESFVWPPPPASGCRPHPRRHLALRSPLPPMAGRVVEAVRPAAQCIRLLSTDWAVLLLCSGGRQPRGSRWRKLAPVACLSSRNPWRFGAQPPLTSDPIVGSEAGQPGQDRSLGRDRLEERVLSQAGAGGGPSGEGTGTTCQIADWSSVVPIFQCPSCAGISVSPFETADGAQDNMLYSMCGSSSAPASRLIELEAHPAHNTRRSAHFILGWFQWRKDGKDALRVSRADTQGENNEK